MNKEILRLAIPNILSNISVPLLSSVDTILMGSLSDLHIGAVGIGSMIFNFIYWNFSFLRMGTTGITAQAYGEENAANIINTLGRALLVAIIIAALILLCQYPFQQFAFWAMNVSLEQSELVKSYFYIRIWGAPAALGLYAMLGWFFGMQNAYYPLILTILINVINIIVSWYLVQHLGLETKGVAIGTVIAQYTGLLAAFILFSIKYKHLFQAYKKPALLKINELKKFLSINRDIFLRTVALTLTFSYFYSQSSENGTLLLAANTILMHFFNWMAYGVDGFAFAAESLIGKYKGKKDKEGTHKALRYSFIWGMGFAVLFSAIFYFFGNDLLRIFTDKNDVIRAALPYLFWVILIPITATPSFIWDGIFVGLTASKAMRNSMLIATAIFFVASFFLIPLYANHGLWLALHIYMVTRGIIQQIQFSRAGLELA